MEYNTDGKKLQICIGGKIDSENAYGIEADISNIIEKESFGELHFDFSDLAYISSAGLRIFMSLAKKYKNMCIENVNSEVWDIFEITGMSQIINVRRRLREISLSSAKLIGDGFYSKVYRVDKETIVKQYMRNPDISDVYRELNLAKQAFVLGIPTAISYDVVLADGKYGVVFEMISGGSLKDVLIKNYGVNSEKTKEIVEEYARLLKTINQTPVSDPLVPSAKGIFLDRMEKSRDLFTPEDFEKLKKLVEAIPEEKKYIHGDCHIKNILYDDNGDMQLIDMDTLSYGNPIFELTGLNACYNGFEMFDPGNNERFLGVKREIIKELYDGVLQVYFDGKSPKEISRIQEQIDVLTLAHMAMWFRENIPENTEIVGKYTEQMGKVIDKTDKLEIEV